MDELFNNLESNLSDVVEEAKKELTKAFSQTKDSWLVSGMMDLYCNTNSMRIVEILVKVQDPHDKYIFDKLLDWISASKRKEAFILFGHIIEKHPSWLYKVASHQLFRETLKVIKNERNINTSLQALSCIQMLLPAIPAQMVDHLGDLTLIFMVLCTWKAKNQPKLVGNQPVHLQSEIEKLFQRLYGMYPCNFLAYLHEHNKDNNIAFVEVIKPLIRNTKMNPNLVASNKSLEMNMSRWKELEPHDILVECEKFTFDNSVSRCDQEHYEHEEMSEVVLPDKFKNIFAPISTVEAGKDKQRMKSTQKFETIWSPSSVVMATPPPTNALSHTPTPTMINPGYNIQTMSAGQYTSGASPPEAAVEATPETTPMKDTFLKHQRSYPVNSTAARTIWGNSSQPSSPMKKDDGFRYPDNMPSATSEKILRMISDRDTMKSLKEKHTTSNEHIDIIEIQNPLYGNEEMSNLSQEDAEVTEINKFVKLVKEPVSFENGNAKSSAEVTKDNRSRLDLFHKMQSIDTFNDSIDISSSSWPGFRQQAPVLSTNKSDADGNVDQSKKNECKTIETQTDITLPTYAPLLIDKFIETSLKRQSITDPNVRAESELQLLYMQLQYERYRRGVYAERNRRLLGKSRDYETQKSDYERLQQQLNLLEKNHQFLEDRSKKAKVAQNLKEHQLRTENDELRDKIQIQLDTNKKLQMQIESLDRRLGEETEDKKKIATILESTQAEIFDVKNLLRQYKDQADVGTKYKEELQRLQCREVLMGEMQTKCGEKLVELANLRAKEGEIAQMKNAFQEEVKELKSDLATRMSQLDTLKERVQILEDKLQRQNNVVGDQKRSVKIVKEEYEEKLKAVEKKYAAQKAIILKFEETIMEGCKHRPFGNSEPDKSVNVDTFGSLDHTSPLSMSLASSEGMSYSLKSVTTEIKNLSHLIDSNNGSSNVFSPSSLNGVSSSSNRLTVSEDIPVPSTSHHYHQ